MVKITDIIWDTDGATADFRKKLLETGKVIIQGHFDCTQYEYIEVEV